VTPRRVAPWRCDFVAGLAIRRAARWSNATDVRPSYSTASVVSAGRIVFNIKGNDYRLVVAVDFEQSIVWIKWIGTHKDYDKIDVKEVQHDR
jgi:mRNA interferase HigB